MTDKTLLTTQELLVRKRCLPQSNERQRIIDQLIATMQRKQKLYDALHDLHALFSETDRTLDEVTVLGEVQELLYGPDPSEYSGVDNKE